MTITFEKAVHDWFAEATGLETVWRDQSAPEPEMPFASLKLIAGPTPIGVAQVTETPSTGRQIQEEIEVRATVPCSMSVSCQVFVKMPDARNPGYNARTYVQRALLSLEMPSTQATFRGRGITINDIKPVQNLDALVEVEHQSRANMDVTFGIVLTKSEYVGYIETVHIQSTTLKFDRDFPVGHR
jgi:hypothetical protein